jgi:DNA-binding response OmpR family regulator
MTSAHSAAVRRLRVVDRQTARAGQPNTPPLVGYLVLVPEGTDPGEILAADGMRAELRPLPPADEALPPPDTSARTGVRIDVGRHIAEVDGWALQLTYPEFELLAHLVANPRRVHTREHLVATLWGYSHVGDGRTVDVHIARLRRKLGPVHRRSVVTVRRVGYKYEPSQASQASQAVSATASRSVTASS